jgi:hypothetical protein
MATVILETQKCMVCKTSTEIDVNLEQYLDYQSGSKVQDAFPDLTDDERELIISGTHPACWDSLFPDDEE